MPSLIAIDNRDLVPAPRQRDRGVQPGGPCPDDDCPHAVPLSTRESDGYAVGHPWYRRMQADKTPASGQASPPLNHPEETACRLIRPALRGLRELWSGPAGCY
jgi:hypothetical protein